MTQIIFTNGCFDVLHKGHVKLLEYASSLGYVVVGLNSDESVKRLKGQHRPFNSAEDRKILLEAIKYVGEVHIFEEDTPLNLIKKIKPDVIVKGGDYTPSEVSGNELAKVIIFGTINGYSSTRSIDFIQSEIGSESKSAFN